MIAQEARSMTRRGSAIAAAVLTVVLHGMAAATEPAADNTGKNVRDRNDATPTPMDQTKGSDADLARTTEIRKAVVDDDGLSTNAQNVKIVTLEGITTLRGPVASAAEKSRVGEIAARIAGGAGKVRNELEVAP
jgi:hyperosmotically inducible periplasmic protein